MEGYSNKDAKIIRENEGKTPYDLLQLGLSQKAYDKMVQEESRQKQAPRQKDVVLNVSADELEAAQEEDTSDAPLTPSVIEEGRPAKPRLGNAAVADETGSVLTQRTIVGPNGIPQKMASGRAVKMATKYPNEYQLLD